jgi:hypothetical protein
MTISLCNSVKPSTTSELTLYTAGSSAGVRIDKFVAHNDTGSASTYSVRIYGPTGTPAHIQPVKVVNRYKADIPASIVGCVIPPNGRLVVSVGVANSIS